MRIIVDTEKDSTKQLHEVYQEVAEELKRRAIEELKERTEEPTKKGDYHED